MPTPFCNKKGEPCDFDEWYACMTEGESELSDIGKQQEADIDGNKFIVWTRFKGFMTWIYDEETEEWTEGEKKIYQTTVDLPRDIKYDPKNPYHVKYYNQKRFEIQAGAEKKQQDVKADIIEDKPIPDKEVVEVVSE